jgi:hypothetical protein
VTTHEEALGTPTSALWDGRDSKKCDAITGALQDAGIPFLTESETEPALVSQEIFAGLLKIFFGRFGAFRKRKSKLFAWRIKVLRSDRLEAEKMIRQIVNAGDGFGETGK